MTFFASPEECENAFYEAFESADIDSMMRAWADRPDVVCVHPAGPRLEGAELIRQVWSEIFKGIPRLAIECKTLSIVRTPDIVVHSLLEHVIIVGETVPRPPMNVTNVYTNTEKGWRLVIHHASPSVDFSDMEEISADDKEDSDEVTFH